MKFSALFAPAVFLLFSFTLVGCSFTTDADKNLVTLNLSEIQQLFQAESVEAWTTEEETSLGKGKHLTVEIVNSAASGTPGFVFKRAKSGAALLTYAACDAAMRKDLVAVRIQPAKRPALAQVMENSLFPTEKLEIQLQCKTVIDQILQARVSKDTLAISRLTNSEVIPDSSLYNILETLDTKFGEYQNAQYQGAGAQKTLGEITYKYFFFTENYANAKVTALYMISTGPKFEMVGLKIDEIK